MISNDKPLKDRKAWIDAIDRCTDQNIDGIAVEFFDRISRKISVLFDLLRYAKEKGVNVYDAYAECELCAEMDKHEKGTAGLTVFKDSDLAMKVQNDRVKRGKKYALERGDSLGGPKPLSDKNPKKHKLIMDAVADGRGGAEPLTWAAIAAQLNTEGVKPPRSRRWTMLLLFKYAGRALKSNRNTRLKKLPAATF